MNNVTDYSTETQILSLLRFGDVPPRMFEALINHFGTVERIHHTDSGTLMSVAGMNADSANRIARASEKLPEAQSYVDELRTRDIAVVSRFSGTYPALLFELNDPPPLLYVRGNLPDMTRKTVVVAGSQNAGQKGMEITARLTKQLVEAGVQIISALDTGIAAAAHLAVRAAGGNSFAVVSGGFDHMKEATDIPVAIDIIQSGGVISEYSPDTKFSDVAYKESNRLLAGLGQAVVITEVYKDSKRTMDLLDCCSQIGKLLFLMIDPEPGALADETSVNHAAHCGAIPMVGWNKVEDIISALV